MARNKSKGEVLCFVHGRKRPIAYCTMGANEIIAAVSEDGCMIQEAYSRINYDQEAKNVLQKYIDLGHDYFTFDPPPSYHVTPPELITPGKKARRRSKEE